MSDRPTSGPAPRYGEYGPAPEQPSPTPSVPEPAVRRTPDGAPARRSGSSTAPAAAHTSPLWDRLLTGALLAFGTVNVLTGIPTMLALPQVLDDQYRIQGFGDYTADALASALGVVINVVSVLLLIAAIVLSVRQLRSGRRAFWIPLVAGATALVVTGVLIVAAMLADPAVPAYLGGAKPTPTATSTP